MSKSRLKFLQTNLKAELFYLGLLSFGISLCFALQLSSFSILFKFLGVNAGNLPWLWIAPPLAGLIIQPLVGQLSDNTVTRFGKRTPYIMGWGILGVLSLLILPLASTFSFALLLTWIIGCSLNGSSEALRAITGDLTKESERPKAFSLQAFFAGVGAALGTSFPYILHKFPFIQEKISIGHVPANIRYSFYIAAVILMITLVISSLNVKEKNIKNSLLKNRKSNIKLHSRLCNIFHDTWKNFLNMSPKFRQICLIHALGWVGLFIFWLYFYTVIAQNIYGIPFDPNAQHGKNFAKALDNASVDTSMYLSFYQYISIICALGLYFLPKKVNQKLLHSFFLLCGGLGIVALGFENQPYQIVLSTIAIGVMWGSMITLPYSIVLEVFPKGKLGIYLGIFNICITAPQLICSLSLSTIYVHLFHRHAGYLLSAGGVLMCLSAYFWFRESKRVGEPHSSTVLAVSLKANQASCEPALQIKKH